MLAADKSRVKATYKISFMVCLHKKVVA